METSKLTARKIMNPNVFSVPDYWNVQALARYFLEKAITGAPVIDSDGNIVGVVSATDIVRYETESDHQLHLDRPHDFYMQTWEERWNVEDFKSFHVEKSSEATVANIMTPVVFKVKADTPVTEIARMMVHGRIHRVIVVDDEKIVGIISALDLVRLLEN